MSDMSRYDPRPFGGNYDQASEPKMKSNLDLVRDFMLGSPGTWFTKEEIRKGSGIDEGTDITPRLRDLRKPQFGAWSIQMQYMDEAYRYMLSPHRSSVISEEKEETDI